MFFVRDIRQGDNISQFYGGNVYLAAQLFRQTVRTEALGRAILAKTVSSEYSLCSQPTFSKFIVFPPVSVVTSACWLFSHESIISPEVKNILIFEIHFC